MINLSRETHGNNEICLGVRFYPVLRLFICVEETFFLHLENKKEKRVGIELTAAPIKSKKKKNNNNTVRLSYYVPSKEMKKGTF